MTFSLSWKGTDALEYVARMVHSDASFPASRNRQFVSVKSVASNDQLDTKIANYCKENLYQLSDELFTQLKTCVISNSVPENEALRKIYSGLVQKPEKVNTKTRIPSDSGHKFEVLPSLKDQDTMRVVLFGDAGSGKSTWCATFAKNWMEGNKSDRCFLISCKDIDKAFDGITHTRLSPKDLDKILSQPDDDDDEENDEQSSARILHFFKDSIVIFDDIDSVRKGVEKYKTDSGSVKKFKPFDVMADVKNILFQLGRSYNVTVCSTHHVILQGKGKTTSMEFSDYTHVVFCKPWKHPRGVGLFLKDYMHAPPTAHRFVGDTSNRWVCLSADYPSLLITETWVVLPESENEMDPPSYD